MRMSDPGKKQPEMGLEDIGNEAGSQAMDAALRSSFVILKVVIAVLAVYLVFSNTFSVENKRRVRLFYVSVSLEPARKMCGNLAFASLGLIRLRKG